MSGRYFYGFVLAFILGIIIFLKFSLSTFVYFLILILIFGIIFIIFNTNYLFLITLFLGFLIGFLRVVNYDLEFIEINTGHIVTEGIIIEERDERENGVNLILQTNSGRFRVATSFYPEFDYGDRVLVEGEVHKPKNFTNKNDIEFDYVNFLAKDKIHYVIYRPTIKLISKNNGSFIKTKLLTFKKSLISKWGRMLPSPHSDLLAGILVGAKQSVGKDLLEKFRIVGLIHIVVLSGYNITIIVEAIRKIFIFFPRYVQMFLIICSIFIFIIFVGAGPTVLRAGIMATIVAISKSCYQNHNVSRALFIAVFLMIFENPFIVLYDPGFQLSFLATLGLIHISPKFENRLGFITNKLQIRAIISATIATQIAVLPLLIKMTGEISIVAIIVNVLVLPIIPPIMFFGAVAGVIAFVNLFLSIPFIYVAYFLLNYLLKIVMWFSSISFSSLSI